VPLFEQLCVLRETDLFNLWAPFVPRAEKIKQITKIELISWFILSVPLFGLSRDAVFHAFGCDCMDTDGSVMIVAESVDQAGAPAGVTIPPEPTGWGSGRMVLRKFSGLVTITSPTSARTRLIANIDPKLALPQKLMDFCMKKMAGVLLLCLQKMAKKVVSDPKCEHAQKMRDDPAFYREYLLPKFQLYADKKGWTMPAVGALAYEDAMNAAAATNGNGAAAKPHQRSNNIIGRAAHKVTKRLAQRKESKLEKERVGLLREAEERMAAGGKLQILSPKLQQRFDRWRGAKSEGGGGSGGKSLLQHVQGLPVWPLVYIYGVSNLLYTQIPAYGGDSSVRLLASVAFVICTMVLFVLSFNGSVTGKKRETLSKTKNFGLVIVMLVGALTCSMFSGAAWFYTFVERKAAFVKHSLEAERAALRASGASAEEITSTESSGDIFGDLVEALNSEAVSNDSAWKLVCADRLKLMLCVMSWVIGIAVFLFLVLVKRHKDQKPVGLGATVMGKKAGGSTREAPPVTPLATERQARLTEKLKQRKETARAR
jgi:hypothetical protein